MDVSSRTCSNALLNPRRSRVRIPLKPWFFQASSLRWSFFTFIYYRSSKMKKKKKKWIISLLHVVIRVVYFINRKETLKISSGIDEPGSLNVPIAISVLAALILVYFCIWKGVRITGKVITWRITWFNLLLAIVASLHPWVYFLRILFISYVGKIRTRLIRIYLEDHWFHKRNAHKYADQNLIHFSPRNSHGSRQFISMIHPYNVLIELSAYVAIPILSPPQRPLCVVGRLGRKKKGARGARCSQFFRLLLFYRDTQQEPLRWREIPL